ncbi:hypothetical protein TEA_016239 [Camellia sinensis var. sinensis]|uniref:Exportin-1/Importin-beta-like domain-containing protein n=1 Tax=Camellia sinensis var. sinensis TaxID=542762 RepID=A0A4V6RY09_CAMSN|nr:hypothetical protein TEA_016239 [Camellia sinensis var. sinensis]
MVERDAVTSDLADLGMTIAQVQLERGPALGEVGLRVARGISCRVRLRVLRSGNSYLVLPLRLLATAWLRLLLMSEIEILLVFSGAMRNSSWKLIALLTAAEGIVCLKVISELIHYTAARNSGGVSAQMPLIQVIVPQVMSLKAQLRDSSKDEEDVKAIARLFADMGDSYLELIANVVSHPEYDIASMTFNFWHNLQINLIERDSYVSFGNEASIEAERNRRQSVFRSSYESLVSLVCFRVQYPQDYAELSKEDLKDFKQTRYDVADVLIDAALVLGGEVTLKILYIKLVEAIMLHNLVNFINTYVGSFIVRIEAEHRVVSAKEEAVGSCGNDEHSNWRPAEAALYCIRAVSDYVSVTEAEVMPQVMSLLPKLPHQPQLLTTVCLTIGAYSKWLDASPSGLSFLPPLIDILVSGMSMSEDSAAAAALAFRHICNDCGKRLCGSLDGLFNIYQRVIIGEGTFKVSAEDSLHLVEALSVVITELPSDHAKKALEVLCLPAVTPLQEIINQGPLVLGQITARELTVHIDRLANIFRYVNYPEAVADAIQRLWPIFKAIFDLRAWDTRTMESLCRACKNASLGGGGIGWAEVAEGMVACFLFSLFAWLVWLERNRHVVQGVAHSVPWLENRLIVVRTSKRFMGITIGAMLEEIQGLYNQHHQPCFLYLSSEVIKDFTSRPDIADDCFLLASRCIRYCPHLFFPSAVFPSLVDCSLIGVTVQHREASNSILTFLSDVFDLGNSNQGEKYVSIRDSVIIPRGATITRILVASLTGALPISRLETVIYALLALTRAYGSRALEWAKDSILLIPSTAATEVERSRFLQALSEVASVGDINSLMIPIEELSEVCRRNRTVQDIVQGALRPLELNFANAIAV